MIEGAIFVEGRLAGHRGPFVLDQRRSPQVPGTCRPRVVELHPNRQPVVGRGALAYVRNSADKKTALAVDRCAGSNWPGVLPFEIVWNVCCLVGRRDRRYFRPAYEKCLLDAAVCDTPQPGVGKTYCFTPTATTELWEGAQTAAADGIGEEITPGDYASAGPWNVIMGAPLNGTWELRVTDLWADDNGFLFSWSMEFAPALAPGCAVIIY